MLNQGFKISSGLAEEKDYLNSFVLLYSHFFFHIIKKLELLRAQEEKIKITN